MSKHSKKDGTHSCVVVVVVVEIVVVIMCGVAQDMDDISKQLQIIKYNGKKKELTFVSTNMFFVGVANGVRVLAEGTTCLGDVLPVDMLVQVSQLFYSVFWLFSSLQDNN